MCFLLSKKRDNACVFRYTGFLLAAVLLPILLLVSGCNRQNGPDYAGMVEELREKEPTDEDAIDELIAYQVRATDRKSYYERQAGLRMMRNGNWEEAIRHLEASVQLNPNDINLHESLAICYANQGRFNPSYLEKAIREYELTIDLAPDRAKPYYGLAVVHYYQGDNNKAIALLHDAIEVDEKFGRSYLLLGKLPMIGKILPWRYKAITGHLNFTVKIHVGPE